MGKKKKNQNKNKDLNKKELKKEISNTATSNAETSNTEILKKDTPNTQTSKKENQNKGVSNKGTSNKEALNKESQEAYTYEQLYAKMSAYEQHIHEMNQKRIKFAIRCFLIIPSCFLAALFLTGSNKIVFLILWIISLFGLSIYLIAVEYMDYLLQMKLKEWSEDENRTVQGLLNIDLDNAAGNLKQALKEFKMEVKDEKHI